MNPKTKTSAGMETVNETVARAKGMIAAPQENTPGMAKNDSVMSLLEERLMGASEGISSSNTEIENAIAGAIGAQEKSRAAGASRIESDYASEKNYLTGQAESDLTTFSQGRSGYATQMAAMRNLTETTDKTMRDLEVRRQDALLANDSVAATQIAALQMKQLEFKQEKEQQFYNNAFQLAGLSLQESAQERAKKEFAATMQFNTEQRTFDRQDKMATLAAQAGVSYDATDTLESLSVKIAKIADEERRAEAQYKLDSLKKDAETEDADLVYDDILSEAISVGKSATQAANAVVTTMREAGQLLSREEYNRVYAKAKELEDEYKKTKARTEAETGGGFMSRLFGGASAPKSQAETPWNMRSGITVDPRQAAIDSYFGLES